MGRFRLPQRPIFNVGINFRSPEEKERQRLANIAASEGIETANLQQQGMRETLQEQERQRNLRNIASYILNEPDYDKDKAPTGLTPDEKAVALSRVSQAMDPEKYSESVEKRQTTLANLAARFWQATRGISNVKLRDEKIEEWNKNMLDANDYATYGKPSKLTALASIAGMTEGMANASALRAANKKTDADEKREANDRINKVINSALKNPNITQEEKDVLGNLDVYTPQKLQIARKYAGKDVEAEKQQLQADVITIGSGVDSATQMGPAQVKESRQQAYLVDRLVRTMQVPKESAARITELFFSPDIVADMIESTETFVKNSDLVLEMQDSAGAMVKYDTGDLIDLFSSQDQKSVADRMLVTSKLSSMGKSNIVNLLNILSTITSGDPDAFIKLNRQLGGNSAEIQELLNAAKKGTYQGTNKSNPATYGATVD